MTQKSKNELMTVKFEVDGNEVKLSPQIVKDYITGGQELSDAEYKFFVEMAKARGLNPFLKEIYAIKFGNQPAQIVVGKDAILKRAIKNSKFNGREQGIIVQKEDGSIEERKGTFKLKDEELVGGWAKVYRKDWDYPTYVSVGFDEVKQVKKDGTLNSNWATKGATMVEKVALVRALRETFTEDLGGMIDSDEAWVQEPKSQEVVDVENAHTTQDEPEIIEAEVVEKVDIENL